MILDKNFKIMGEKQKSVILKQFKSENKDKKRAGKKLNTDFENDEKLMNESS